MHRLLFVPLIAAFLVTTVSCGVTITIITLPGNGLDHTMDFCGDQTAVFPVDHEVNLKFKPGTPCASVLSVNLM